MNFCGKMKRVTNRHIAEHGNALPLESVGDIKVLLRFVSFYVHV